jgi:hypothetical protein
MYAAQGNYSKKKFSNSTETQMHRDYTVA